jgi:ubiquinone/menaquinone biosynthesis C-methylase UbiE
VREKSAGGHNFSHEPGRLRSEARLARLEPDRVVSLSKDGVRLASMLDVGTGTGLFAEAFAHAGIEATGLDVSPDLLAGAKGHLPQASFVAGKAEYLPFADHSFDLVFFGSVLHEAEDVLKALKEAGRAARVRVAILEWPYRREASGPPLEQRLKPERIGELALGIGFQDVERIELAHMDLYRLSP